MEGTVVIQTVLDGVLFRIAERSWQVPRALFQDARFGSWLCQNAFREGVHVSSYWLTGLRQVGGLVDFQ